MFSINKIVKSIISKEFCVKIMRLIEGNIIYTIIWLLPTKLKVWLSQICYVIPLL